MIVNSALLYLHGRRPAVCFRQADVYLPVCACCTGWMIFCTASVDRQTHCNSFSPRCCCSAGCSFNPLSISHHPALHRGDVLSKKERKEKKQNLSGQRNSLSLPNAFLNAAPARAFLEALHHNHDGAVYCISHICEEFGSGFVFQPSSPFIFSFALKFPSLLCSLSPHLFPLGV